MSESVLRRLDASDKRDVPPGVPVIHYDHSGSTEPLGHFRYLYEIGQLGPIVWNDFGPGFWMVTDYDLVKEAYQDYATFTSDSILVTDPNPQHKWLPTMVNPPEHVKYRQLLNPMFGPNAIAANTERSRATVNRVLDRFAGDGRAEVMSAFCGPAPTEVFLQLVGLPAADGSRVAEWVADVFDHMHNLDRAPMVVALNKIGEYFSEKIAERRGPAADPAIPRTDIVSVLCDSDFDGEPISDADILNICNTLALAGLDTTRSQLGHALLHFATHDDDRALLLRKPELWPSAVEELLRFYAIVSNDGRKVADDVEFHGCPMKKGDMAMMSLAPACRNPDVFPDPDTFVADREPNRHLAFAAGPHRCLGSHLARMELAVAMQEWHRRIPNYRVSDNGLGRERGSQISLLTLELEWDVARTSP